MKSIQRESLTESSFSVREIVDGGGNDGDYYSAKEIIPMGEESFIPLKSAIHGAVDANENYDNDIAMSERRSSLTIHDISIDNDYSNDLDISIGGSLDDDESQEDLFHEDQPQKYPPQQQRKKSFMKVLRTQESEMSLQSFTSINSFSSHQGGGERSRSSGDYHSSSLELGDLTFCTDDEVATLMYSEDDVNNKNDEDGSSSLPPEATATNLAASLPPSSTLGTGAFSTVRLAWRTTTTTTTSFEDNPCAVHNRADRTPSTMSWSCQDDQVVADATSSTQPQYKKRELVAVKIIQKSILKQIKSIQRGPNNRLMVHTAYDNIEREIATMKRLRHPNVVRLFEVIDSVESDRLYMVLEYVSLGEILSHVDGTDRYTRMRYRKKVRGLTSEGHFDETHAALYFVDILHGLAYLHRNRICHRDLKPENILLCASGIAKISDFGVAHIFEDEKLRDSKKQQPDCCGDIDGSVHHLSQHESDVALNMPSKYNTGMLKKTEGTWCFWSPEMCSSSISSGGDESKGFSGYAADLWAAGVCLYIFTTGRLPFFSLSPSDLFQLIARAEVQYEGLGLSNELTDLLRKLLTKDPAVRAGVGDCLKHKFCAAARTKRIHELDSKFKGSERQIVLSKNDVDMALSVFKSQKHAQLVVGAVMTNNNIIDLATNRSASTSPPAPSPSPSHISIDNLPQAWDFRNDSNLTKSAIETLVEPKERNNSPRKLSRLSSTSVRLGKTMRNIFNYIRNVEVDTN